VAFVDDHKQGNELCTHKWHTQVDRSGRKSNMLENNLESQTTQRSKDLFPKVHHPLRNGYVSVEELVRDNSLRTRSVLVVDG
jgi:hypothetical protein